MIFDSTANLVAAFDDEHEAHAALEAIARRDPQAADEYALLVYGDDGRLAGDAIPAAQSGTTTA